MSRHGHYVEADTISKIDESDEGYGIDRENGWGTLYLSKDECNGFVPQVGDAIVVFLRNSTLVVGVIIENHVIRYKTAQQYEEDHKTMVEGFRLKKLERYIEHGAELKARVEKLHPKLKARMERFAAESGEEFWIDSADYEMICLEGANALLNKVFELYGADKPFDAHIKWINDWWDINSDKHDPPYDYQKQMSLVPDFGEGHSGNTAGAAKFMAVAVLDGTEI